MAKFNLENYETVEDRLKKFWKDFPKGRIDSNVVHITDDGTCVTIRTEIYKDIEDTKPVTTGIAQETKGQGGFANADAWMENCETSSWGRALANLSLHGGKVASAEEIKTAQNHQEMIDGWEQWGNAAIAQVQACKTLDELKAWDNANSEGSDGCHVHAPDVWQIVAAEMVKKESELGVMQNG